MPAAGIVTSKTHPVNPDIGDRIFETDTGKILYWYGPYYKWLPQWGAGGRLLGWAEVTGPIGAVADALVVTIPFLQVQGRTLYWVASFTAQRASGVNGIFQLTDANNVVLNDRNLNVSTAIALQLPVTIGYREFGLPTQQVDVTRKLRVVAGTIPAGIFNLFCFDEGYGVAMAGNIPVWDTAVWDTNLWGS